MTTQESREQEIKRLNAEKVKQIALCHFYSYYVRHNMSDMLAYVGEDVTWLGSQSDFVAHNRQEFENLLEREIKKVPKQCVMKVISADVSQVSGNCYQVTGELELRLPVQDNVYYTNLRFSMMICKEDGKFSIVSIHTSTIGKSVLWDDTQVLKERQKQFSEEGGENIQDPVTGVFQLGAFKERAARQLEDISNSFKGVEKSFAIQAGREVRVMVIPEKVSDDDMILLARDIAKQVEDELKYPGQIKVNVIRESRVTDYAK